MNESPDWTLTGAQRRCLGVALRQIERDLAIMADFAARTAPTATDPFVDDLDEGARHQLRHAIAEARTVIGELRAAFGLERESVSTSRWIAGQLPRLWVAAEECQARYLRGYGPVPPGLAEQLDPKARRLAELLVDMFTIARGRAVGSGPRIDV
jgi:hypothetical protein